MIFTYFIVIILLLSFYRQIPNRGCARIFPPQINGAVVLPNRIPIPARKEKPRIINLAAFLFFDGKLL
jgi:hypothetical protein